MYNWQAVLFQDDGIRATELAFSNTGNLVVAVGFTVKSCCLFGNDYKRVKTNFC